MLVVGLTGGIASGKSTVAGIFSRFGAALIDADAVAREVVEPGSEGLRALVDHFGDGILTPDGALDRRAMRRRMVDDVEARETLEAILHPRIRSVMAGRREELAGAGHAYAIEVIPLLVETGAQARLDRVLVVDVPETVQQARLEARDGSSPADAAKLLGQQASRWCRLRHAHDVITNADDGAPERALGCQVLALDRKFRALAAATR